MPGGFEVFFGFRHGAVEIVQAAEMSVDRGGRSVEGSVCACGHFYPARMMNEREPARKGGVRAGVPALKWFGVLVRFDVVHHPFFQLGRFDRDTVAGNIGCHHASPLIVEGLFM